MNTLKTLGIALVVCFSLVLNGLACVLIAMSIRQQPPIQDADIVVAGVGNSANEITGHTSPRRLVRRVMERPDVAPVVTDAMLQAATAALVDKGVRGDPDGAAFLFELAAAQRGKTGATTAPSREPRVQQ